MKKLLYLSLLVFAAPAFAQDAPPTRLDLRRDAARDVEAPTVSGTLAPTPEMWFYSQERKRYDSPRDAVRRRAEARATERQARLESMRWYGMSNSRPLASVTPLFGTYSPTWVSNTADPSRWRMTAPTTVVVTPTVLTR